MLKNILPNEIYEAIDNIPYANLCELRIRKDSPVVVNVLGDNYYLCSNKLSKTSSDAITPSNGLLQGIIQRISNNSFYTINDQLIDGYVTIDGGIRVGVCGEVVSVNDEIKTLKNISSLNFRFPHFVKNCSLNIYPYIVKNGVVKNTLIISPPGAGKTTYLRDLIYQISCREDLINILVIDERNEIASIYNGEEISNLKNVDIYSNSSKKFGLNNGIRSMKPSLIVTDELNLDKDIEDIENALTCGVKIIATIHASSIFDLKNKPTFKSILSKGLFERFVVLSNSNGVGTLEGVYNENLIFLGV